MFVFLMILFLIQSTGCAAGESGVLNGSAKGSDGPDAGHQKVCPCCTGKHLLNSGELL